MAENAIPFFGPIVQMLRRKSQFHLEMRNEYRLPAPTLRLPGIRIYVLNKLALIIAAQKQHPVLSFEPIMGQLSARFLEQAIRQTRPWAMARDVLTDEGFLLGFSKAIYHTLAPGSSLDCLTRRAASIFVERTDEMEMDTGGAHRVSFFVWMRSTILDGTTNAIYGTQTSFHDPVIEAEWYAFEPEVTKLAMRFIPSFATRKTRRARDVLVKSFVNYFHLGCPEEASDFMKARYDNIVRHRITDVQDIARLEVAGAFSIITNTAPTVFWMLYHIFSDTAVFDECGLELSPLVHERDGVCYLGVKSVKESCPVLHSTVHEVLRFHGVAQSIRAVLEDHKLNNTHLLKKGSMAMMPATVQHFDPSVWGDSANQFDHKRFTKAASDGNGYEFDSKRINRGAFRGFGGGIHLCPGRHFAMNEILSLTSLLILRFDIYPNKDESWPIIRTDSLSSKGSAIIIPDTDLDVEFHP